MEWKWSTGEFYQRSKRPSKENKIVENQINLDAIRENSAYLQSLNVEDSWGDPKNTSFYENQINNDFVVSNKREDSSFRMAERDMIATTGLNPFLENNNYVKDIVARDLFLKPVNTNADREK